MARTVYFVCYHGVGWSDHLAGEFIYYLSYMGIKDVNVDSCGIYYNRIYTINEGDIFVAKDRVVFRKMEERGAYCFLYDRILDDNQGNTRRVYEFLAQIATGNE